MASRVKVGYFQTLEYDSPTSPVTIRDDIHGSHIITEPVLIELLQSSALRRLSGVYQAGISGYLKLTPSITRFEHSVGAFLLVRKAGAQLDEQIAGLLHDVSHTVLSHVMDWALSKPGESFHEVHKDRYLETTNIPDILIRHGFEDLKPLDEELYGLVEQPAPHLCADRLDYGVRDAVAFGSISLDQAHLILASICAYPDATSENRMLVSADANLALVLSRGYLAADRDVWSNPAHIDMSKRIGKLIGDAVRGGIIKESYLWAVSDDDFWDALYEAVSDEGRKDMDRIRAEPLSKKDDMGIPAKAKVRVLDPDVLSASKDVALPLSSVSSTWAEEKEAYIRSKDALRVTNTNGVIHTP